MNILNRNKEKKNFKSVQKQSYEKPVMEITLFETEDIITTSPPDEEIEI